MIKGNPLELAIDNRDLPVGSIDLYQTFVGDMSAEFLEETGRDRLKNDGYNPDDYEIEVRANVAEVRHDHAQASVNILRSLVPTDDIVLAISDPLNTTSPKFYNHTTDSYVAKWTLDRTKLADYIKANATEHDKWAKQQWGMSLDIKRDTLNSLVDILAKRERAAFRVRNPDLNARASIAHWQQRIAEARTDLEETNWVVALGFYLAQTVRTEEYTSRMYGVSGDLWHEHSTIRVIKHRGRKEN